MLPRSLLTGGACLLAGLCAPLSFASPDPEAGLPFLDTISRREYHGSQQVWGIAEDAAGLLYFGNFDKVLVYDGARWTHVPVPGATTIRALAVDRDDTLWIGGIDEFGYARTDAAGVRTFVSLLPQLPPEARGFGNIWQIVLTPRGILFHASKWLLRWDGSRLAALQMSDTAGWRLTAVGPEAWATNTGLGWFRVRDDGQALSLEPIARPPELDGERIWGAVSSGKPGEFLLGLDSQALWRWDGRTFAPFPTDDDADLRRYRIYSMCPLADGRIALCSTQGGVWILDTQGRQLARLTEQNGLPSNTAFAVFAPRDGGTLWISLNNGIVRADVRPWLTGFGAASGVPRTKLLLPVRHRGRLLIPGATAGVLRLEPATRESPARIVSEPIAIPQVVGLAVAGDTRIIAATSGIFELDSRGEVTRLKNSPVQTLSFVPLHGHPGTWIGLGGFQVRLYRREPEGWRIIGPIAGLKRVRTVAVDHDGSWWSTTLTGEVQHARFRHESDLEPTVETFVPPDAVPPDAGLMRFTNDARGPLLSCNRGFFRFDPATRRFRPTGEYGAPANMAHRPPTARPPSGQPASTRGAAFG